MIRLCEQPLNYVPNADDCNDTDFYVHPESQAPHVGEFELDGTTPYVHRERCNGKVDLCENDVHGDLTPPDNEIDDDGDGFVECDLGLLNLLQWENKSQTIVGGLDRDDLSPQGAEYYPGHLLLTEVAYPEGCYLDEDGDGFGDSFASQSPYGTDYTAGADCDDGDAYAYPDAPELCNGAFEDCNDPLYIALSQSALKMLFKRLPMMRSMMMETALWSVLVLMRVFGRGRAQLCAS